MPFSSVTFLFCFLPLVLLATLLYRKTAWRNSVLLFSSLLFYFWGEGLHTLLLIASILTNYRIGLLLEQREGARQRRLLITGIVINLLPLFLFKYLSFLLSILTPLFRPFSVTIPELPALHLPAGISFFTFLAISYLVDITRRTSIASTRLSSFSLYLAMFPQLLAGPIVRYHQLADQIASRTLTVSSFSRGAERFIFGLAKKSLLADPLGAKADMLFQLPIAQLSCIDAWLGAICYTLQIYYDFSGYSDMAIGIAEMLGFRLPENFRYPYQATSVQDFWRRWHISLSSWLRDYLYIPLGGNRKGQFRTLVNLLLVFLACGLWHGANWTYIVWGCWHGAFLVIERLMPKRQNGRILLGLSWLYTMLIVVLGWVVFRSSSLTAALEYLSSMAGTGASLSRPILGADTKLFMELLLACILSLPLYTTVKRWGTAWETRPQTASALRLPLLLSTFFQGGRLLLLGILLYFSLITVAVQAYQPFLYFQF